MRREEMLQAVESQGNTPWDLAVIGGGATGLGIATDAAARGYRTVLLEQSDFAKGTSSRSTKLVHGGVRYLAQGDIPLVLEALRERGLLRRNAPHLVRSQPFIIPVYNRVDGPFYLLGMKVYDLLAGRLGLSPSRRLTRRETMEALPNVQTDGLRGGVVYYDGQFDDARLAVNLAQTSAERGGVLLNYMRVTSLLKDNTGRINGLKATDLESGVEYAIRARVVFNATGVFVDDILRMDAPDNARLVQPSQGVHVVLDRSFLQSDSALMIPKTPDGRVLFALPWYDKVIVGTTDTPLEKCSLEPRALEEEIDFILTTAGQYLRRQPRRRDVLAHFAGLRPLAAPKEGATRTKEISRSHHLIVSASGLVTMTGGKWTTYRKMAEDAVDRAVREAGLPRRGCTTRDLRIHGWTSEVDLGDPLHIYGTDGDHIRALAVENPELARQIHPRLSLTAAEVVWAARQEMARTVEDVLSRRHRALLLDARAASESAPAVAALLADELGRDAAWQREQVDQFSTLAAGYYFP